MNPCTGINGVCPPLCTYKELKDGTYTISDVLRFNQVLEEHINAYKRNNNG